VPIVIHLSMKLLVPIVPAGMALNHSARALSDAVTDSALHLGLSSNIVRTGGSDGVMRIAPPLTATEAEIDLGLDLLDAALEQTLEKLPRVRAAE